MCTKLTQLSATGTSLPFICSVALLGEIVTSLKSRGPQIDRTLVCRSLLQLPIAQSILTPKEVEAAVRFHQVYHVDPLPQCDKLKRRQTLLVVITH